MSGHLVDTSGASGDHLARGLVGVLQAIAMAQLMEPGARWLDVCAACGALERADRACQLCKARRRAA